MQPNYTVGRRHTVIYAQLHVAFFFLLQWTTVPWYHFVRQLSLVVLPLTCLASFSVPAMPHITTRH